MCILTSPRPKKPLFLCLCPRFYHSLWSGTRSNMKVMDDLWIMFEHVTLSLTLQVHPILFSETECLLVQQHLQGLRPVS